jgi:hypothetical protein
LITLQIPCGTKSGYCQISSGIQPGSFQEKWKALNFGWAFNPNNEIGPENVRQACSQGVEHVARTVQIGAINLFDSRSLMLKSENKHPCRVYRRDNLRGMARNDILIFVIFPQNAHQYFSSAGMKKAIRLIDYDNASARLSNDIKNCKNLPNASPTLRERNGQIISAGAFL